MASSSEKSIKLPEKSSFSQTCNLLSQYLTERGSLGMSCNVIEGNGVAEIPRQPAATAPIMNLFPMIDNSGDLSSRKRDSMNLFPQQAGFAPKKDTPSMRDLDSSLNTPMEPQKAQMTIFYGGQVIVFNDFPADKANEIMQLASKGSLQRQSRNSFAANLARSPIESSPPVTPSLPELSCSVPPSPRSNGIPSFANNPTPERPQQLPSRPVACDLPIARRNSLHRFLEKRKDRIVSRAAPYQVSSSTEAPNKPAESKPWLGLAAQTSH